MNQLKFLQNWVVMLKELHCSHIRIVKMKALARSFNWWPNIDHAVLCKRKQAKVLLIHGNFLEHHGKEFMLIFLDHFWTASSRLLWMPTQNGWKNCLQIQLLLPKPLNYYKRYLWELDYHLHWLMIMEAILSLKSSKVFLCSNGTHHKLSSCFILLLMVKQGISY